MASRFARAVHRANVPTQHLRWRHLCIDNDGFNLASDTIEGGSSSGFRSYSSSPSLFKMSPKRRVERMPNERGGGSSQTSLKIQPLNRRINDLSDELHPRKDSNIAPKVAKQSYKKKTYAKAPTRTIFYIRRMLTRTGTIIVRRSVVSSCDIRKIRTKQGEGHSGRSAGRCSFNCPTIRSSSVLGHGIAYLLEA